MLDAVARTVARLPARSAMRLQIQINCSRCEASHRPRSTWRVRMHAAMDAQSRGKIPEALQHYAKAVELDPTFGLGYQGLSTMSRNLGHLQDAEKYAADALNTSTR